jgi:hypothetical protein
MKTMKLKFRSLALVPLVFIAVFAVSCEKEEDMLTEQQSAIQQV